MTVRRRISLLVTGAGFVASLLFSLAVFAELVEQPFRILDVELEEEAHRAARLVAVRLKVDRGKIQEVEHLYDRDIDAAAVPLLTTPVTLLTEDVPSDKRLSRDMLFRAANSYFDALEGDSGRIGAFSDKCVRHENGYQTVNNPPPGGRLGKTTTPLSRSPMR